jgi:hypothetical protein
MKAMFSLYFYCVFLNLVENFSVVHNKKVITIYIYSMARGRMLNLLNNFIQGNLTFALAIFYIFLLDGECPLSILEFPPE